MGKVVYLPLRKFAAVLDIDSATYWKIERGDRRAKREHIPIIAEILQADFEELLILWLADQVVAVVENDKGISGKVFGVVKQKINE